MFYHKFFSKMELLVLWRCWYSQEQETVIQSRRVGVTKIASRWGRGASMLPYIGGAASDIEPAKYWWDIM